MTRTTHQTTPVGMSTRSGKQGHARVTIVTLHGSNKDGNALLPQHLNSFRLSKKPGFRILTKETELNQVPKIGRKLPHHNSNGGQHLAHQYSNGRKLGKGRCAILHALHLSTQNLWTPGTSAEVDPLTKE